MPRYSRWRWLSARGLPSFWEHTIRSCPVAICSICYATRRSRLPRCRLPCRPAAADAVAGTAHHDRRRRGVSPRKSSRFGARGDGCSTPMDPRRPRSGPRSRECIRRRPVAVDWPTDCQHPRLYLGCRLAAGADRRGGRALFGRRRRGGGISQSARVDRGAVPRQSVLGG